MKQVLKHWQIALLVVIALSDGLIWYVVEREAPTKTLTVAFLNIGQGDAIYI
jgi:hypothetical protein